MINSSENFIEKNEGFFVIIFLFIMAVMRSVLDDFWISYYDTWIMYSLTFFNTLVYIYLLYLTTADMICYFLKKIWNIDIEKVNLKKIYFFSAFLWITYPLVSLISMISDSPPVRTIAFFKYLPFFMTEKNFFPLGMIAVIPVLFAGYTFLIAVYGRVNYGKVFISLLLSFIIIYLLFYQYLLRLSYYIFEETSVFIFFGFYTLSFIVFTWRSTGKFINLYNNTKGIIKNFFIINTVICIFVLFFGIYLKTRPIIQKNYYDFSVLNNITFSENHIAAWKLFLILIHDDREKLAGYGFIIISSKEETPRLFIKVLNREFDDYNKLTWIKRGFQLNGMIFDFNFNDKLVFEWNQNPAGKDPFLETFRGLDYLYSGTVFIDKFNYRAIILQEDLTGDTNKFNLWNYETFLFLKNEDINLIAFQYDDYSDGIICFKGNFYQVKNVHRSGNKIRILFSEGEILITCSTEAKYDIYKIPEGPLEEVLLCNVLIKRGEDFFSLENVPGHMELIGESE